jgi:hypothetical protein
MRGGVPVFRRSTTKGPFAQARGQRGRGRIAGAAGGVLRLADVDLAGEEGAGGEHHRGRFEADAGLRDRTAHRVAFDDQVVDGGLEHGEVGLRFHHAADRGAIQRAVGLAARRAHRGTFRCVERAPLDARGVGRARHRATERVDLLHEVALADATDRRIAAHRADGFDVVREQQSACAGARCSERRFGARVAAADDDHVVKMEGRTRHGAHFSSACLLRRASAAWLMQLNDAGNSLARFLRQYPCTRSGRRTTRRRIGTGAGKYTPGKRRGRMSGDVRPLFLPAICRDVLPPRRSGETPALRIQQRKAPPKAALWRGGRRPAGCGTGGIRGSPRGVDMVGCRRLRRKRRNLSLAAYCATVTAGRNPQRSP